MPKKKLSKRRSTLTPAGMAWLKKEVAWKKKQAEIIKTLVSKPPLPEAEYRAQLSRMNTELNEAVQKVVSASDPAAVRRFREIQRTSSGPMETIKRAHAEEIVSEKDSLARQLSMRAFELAIKRADFIELQRIRNEIQRVKDEQSKK